MKARIEQYQRRSAEQLLVLAAFNASEELRMKSIRSVEIEYFHLLQFSIQQCGFHGGD